MRLFRRRDQEPDPPIPEWASFFDREEYRAFLGVVDLTLEALGHERTWGDGVVEIEVDGEPVQLGLSNLAQTLRGAPHEEWNGLAAAHFGAVTNQPDAGDMGVEEARAILKLRLWARDQLPENLELVAKPFADDLLVVLALDFPQSVTNAKPDHLAAWGLSEEQAFAIAERNTRAEPGLETEPAELGDGAVAWLTIGDSFFTASQVLWPEQTAGEIPPNGALVAVPNRHVAWIHPITDLRVVGVVTTSAQWAHGNFVDGPGSISPHLYWWRPGEVRRIQTEVTDDAVQITPPDEFVELLNQLGEQEPDDGPR
ncbi:MAG: hypothetical protein AVDCRST_MAG85-3703 [uncultured Solirubrobacteraceae bacterium]|uniref:Uncharacterized protein n=1 Tax=uncultured Solirubrobacteraceae bacterium TaxID=1162706 RepID=A0A6J4TSC5_9ACTN|nr:MAG: hypothetical protein AVDCRST_MAG85-3703 [uncultured Solirubrobacteraceae bacterium]